MRFQLGEQVNILNGPICNCNPRSCLKTVQMGRMFTFAFGLESYLDTALVLFLGHPNDSSFFGKLSNGEIIFARVV